ncbi:MAG: GtrA family protein [Pseudomonadota bacterium]
MQPSKPLSKSQVLLRYALFAAVASACNLLAQHAVLTVGSTSAWFLAALIVGTATGLIIKYVLDARWVFQVAERSPAQHAGRFSLYSVTGLFTTLIFWGTESVFWFTTHDHAMRELGATIGLAIGYVLKYRLDKRWVFTRPTP